MPHPSAVNSNSAEASSVTLTAGLSSPHSSKRYATRLKRPLTLQDETQEEQRRRAWIARWSNRYPRSTADQAFWG
jgi:hypothetical protein